MEVSSGEVIAQGGRDANVRPRNRRKEETTDYTDFTDF
jgi:hypothetical protein